MHTIHTGTIEHLTRMIFALSIICMHPHLYAEPGPHTITWIPSESAEEQGYC